MIGWQFSVSSPVTVTALAYVDPKKTGLVEAHRVAIFDQTGTILVSATVQPGAGVAAQDGFRLSTVNNYTLQPGTYVIAGQRLSDADNPLVRATCLPSIPQITYIQERELATSDFTVPTQTNVLNEGGAFGPSFVVAETAAPTRTITDIVNSGTYISSFTPGMYVTIFGKNLASGARAWAQSDFRGNTLPTSLDGISVLADGKPAYVEYISSGQINIILPESITLPSSTSEVKYSRIAITVKSPGQPDLTGWASVFPAAPAFFTWLTDTADSGKYVVATHADGTRVGKVGLFPALPANFTTPARPGETIVLYGTAFGATNPAAPTGALADKAYALATLPTATVGGKPATVAYAGLVASLARVYQVNLTIPADLTNGDWPVVVNAGSNSSSLLVTVVR